MHSYLTPLTGITAELIEANGVSLAEAVGQLRTALPKHAVLVGQNIGKDVQWLGLEDGQDFESMLDLAGVWRVWNKKYNSWSVFGQDHLVRVLLGVDMGAQHNAAMDALKSIRLFNYWHYHESLPDGAGKQALEEAKQRLLDTPPEPSFAKLNPSFEGVLHGQQEDVHVRRAVLRMTARGRRLRRRRGERRTYYFNRRDYLVYYTWDRKRKTIHRGWG